MGVAQHWPMRRIQACKWQSALKATKNSGLTFDSLDSSKYLS